MSLVGQTVWVVGGVGVVGRGICRGLLKAGATVIVNSRSAERLDRVSADLGHPQRLVTVHGSLLPGYAQKTVSETLSAQNQLHHVVAHGAVRYWTAQKAGCDESLTLNANASSNILDMKIDDFASSASSLASLHFSAAQELIPRLQVSPNSTYTFVTGDGGGHPSTRRSPMGEINSHHVWGLSAALRGHQMNPVTREIRVGLPVNRSEEERTIEPRDRPLSEDIGDLCAGLVASAGGDDNGRLIMVDEQKTLETLLVEYNVAHDKNVGPLPSLWEFTGSL